MGPQYHSAGKRGWVCVEKGKKIKKKKKVHLPGSNTGYL